MLAALGGDAVRAEAVPDALHNLPHRLGIGHERGWTIAGFGELFLAPLIERYPDLVTIRSKPAHRAPSVPDDAIHIAERRARAVSVRPYPHRRDATLEEHLAQTLFTRSENGLQPTDIAGRFVPHAEARLGRPGGELLAPWFHRS
ncbi:MAG: hypothetical protein JWP97_5386 [Labilithrix sp.]|nr:hypothetical protein [Labilithrix sp.]